MGSCIKCNTLGNTISNKEVIMLKQYQLTEATLTSWVEKLQKFDDEAVIKEIKDLLQAKQEVIKNKGMDFNDIEVGKTYRVREWEFTKKYLWGATFTITDKKIKNVIAELQERRGKYSKGARFSMPPEALEEL